jgi:hypothetical protein
MLESTMFDLLRIGDWIAGLAAANGWVYDRETRIVLEYKPQGGARIKQRP